MNLRPNQIKHAKALSRMKGAMLIDDPGAGKTATTLRAIKLLCKKALVVAPNFVARTVWEKEARIWEPSLIVATFTGKSAPGRWWMLENFVADVYVINYELIGWIYKQYLLYGKALPRFDIIVLDEIHKVKNSQGRTNKRLQYFTSRASHVWGLTGTPIGKSIEDVYGQARMIGVDQDLARNITAFRRKWFMPKNPGNFFQWRPLRGSEKEIMEVMRPYMLRSETQSYESENYTEINIDVPLNADARAIYNKVKRDLFAEIGDKKLSVANAAVATGKLTQITGGAVYHEKPLEERREGDEREVMRIHTDKFKACMELIETLHGYPVLLAYHYEHELRSLFDALGKTDLEFATLTSASMQMFNRWKLDVLLVHPQSAGHGLNLQHACHHMIIYSMASFWSQAAWKQFIGRLARPGQKHTVRVHKLMCPGTIDYVIEDVCHGRIELNDDFMEYML